MAPPATVERAAVTLAEYLAFERDAAEKHMLWDGEIFKAWAMSGGSPAHNTISANAIGAFYVALRCGRCRVMTSDQNVWIPRKNGIVYPDVTVVCGRVELLEGTTDVVTNPSVIVEVLSPSTETFDRIDKFAGYRSVASLRHYVMVSSTGTLVERYARGDDGGWTLWEHGAGDVFTLSSPEVSMRVDELYAGAFDERIGD